MDQLLNSIMVGAIRPAYAHLPPKMNSPAASALLLAIGLQESGLTARYQLVKQKAGHPLIKGPARGIGQFEKRGGVRGVMTHPTTKAHAEWLCRALGVPWDIDQIYNELEYDDVLAAGFMRLLLYSDPQPLPTVHADPEEGWQYYLRTWRPRLSRNPDGAEARARRKDWTENHERAIHYITGDDL